MGRRQLGDALRLCRAPTTTAEVSSLIDWLQQPFFELSEGDYPFPSTYISYAVGNVDIPLPAWPMRVACSKISAITASIELRGSLTDVAFTVVINGEETVVVDWDTVNGIPGPASDAVLELLSGLGAAVGIWYNISEKVSCYNAFSESDADVDDVTHVVSPPLDVPDGALLPLGDPSDICTGAVIPGGNAAAWGVLVCNEGQLP